MKKIEDKTPNILYVIATILIFSLIFFVKDKNNKTIQAVAKEQTIQKTP